MNPIDFRDEALVALLKQLTATIDRVEIRELSAKIERVVFHKQFTNPQISG